MNFQQWMLLSGVGLAVIIGGQGGCIPADSPNASGAEDSESSEVSISRQAADCPTLPVNQKATLMPKVSSGFPIKVQIDPTLSMEVLQSTVWALKAWNAFSRSQVGYDFFSVESWDYSIQDDRPESPGDCSFSRTGQSGFRVIQAGSLPQWESMGFTSANPAATLRCQSSGKLTRQVIAVYPPSLRSAQVRSVMLHELGHALGLDHSCQLAGGHESFVACTSIPAGHPYRIAVMYPTLKVSVRGGASASSSTDEVKEMLQENDRARAGCLYSVEDGGSGV